MTGSADTVELGLIVPVYNEATGLPDFLARLLPVLEETGLAYEVCFVDDGSSDGTVAYLQGRCRTDAHLRLIELSRNFGKEAALSAGLDHVRGRAVIPIDADGQDPPELIPELIAQWRSGYEVVYAIRRDRRSDRLLRRLAAWIFYRSLNAVSEVRIPADVGDYRLLDRQVVEALQRLPERTRFMKGLFAWIGFRQIGVPYHREARGSGRSGWSPGGLWRLAWDGVISFSALPLRVWSWLGALIALASMGYGAWLVIRTLAFGRDVPGYASLMVATLFLNGLLMLSVGMLGAYVSRVFTEVKGRPLYVVRRRSEDAREP